MFSKKIQSIHPGEILMEEFLKPLKITQYKLAKDVAVPAIRINEIIRGKRAITADSALRLGKYFNTSPEFWLNLQVRYDLEKQREVSCKKLDQEVKVLKYATNF
ncbi:addiction module antidote protein, HigA family [Candidatus Falkowbacteria bacterium RBG_13_39_14]|uniref:Addiction module antidote protein, HigA family n=1 Tax=Candidatus Falkowbacteria bacterium RBG_13_39_14 TaxID=1797985 RepID=A0A1F5S7C6_9BACT|nr:MAG: addiction module antidote protein, HigA family [Candidatus Falkowbacteria bacterium RBG_13_39_14]